MTACPVNVITIKPWHEEWHKTTKPCIDCGLWPALTSLCTDYRYSNVDDRLINSFSYGITLAVDKSQWRDTQHDITCLQESHTNDFTLYADRSLNDLRVTQFHTSSVADLHKAKLSIQHQLLHHAAQQREEKEGNVTEREVEANQAHKRTLPAYPLGKTCSARLLTRVEHTSTPPANPPGQYIHCHAPAFPPGWA